MNTKETGLKINYDKEKIIEMYNNGMDILKLAEKYEVTTQTLCKHLLKWGIKVKRGDWHINYVKPKYTRKFSPELLEKIRRNTIINRRYMSHGAK